jgi:hypothetical protein
VQNLFGHSETSGEVVPFGLRVLQKAPSDRLRVCKVRYVSNRERAFETVGDLPLCPGGGGEVLFSFFGLLIRPSSCWACRLRGMIRFHGRFLSRGSLRLL